jgi:phage anti-repressor protein
MNQIIKAENVDLKSLIEKDVNLSINFKSKILDTLVNEFTDKEQKWYIANLYIYLNFHATNDYPINLENVYKLVGFTTKSNAKRTLLNNFTADEDYKSTVIPRDDGGKFTDETIMLSTNTFKGLCMLVKTDKAKEIRKYYIKLENIFNKIVNEERLDYELKTKELENAIIEKDLLIENLENKPETEGFNRKQGYIYIADDSDKLGHKKIGSCGIDKINKRIDALNVSSSTRSLKMIYKFKTFDVKFVEEMVHSALYPLKIRNRNEWFYIKSELELNYVINTINKCIKFAENYNIKEYNQLDNIIKTIGIPPQQETKVIEQPEELEEDYIGVIWTKTKNRWKACLGYNNKNYHLGYFTNKIDAAKAYNDYALYLNFEKELKGITTRIYTLNDILGYISTPRNIPEELKLLNKKNKTSKWTGVRYIKARDNFNAYITIDHKTVIIVTGKTELDCAKAYNQQALYYNNTKKTNYILNDIPDYINIAKDVKTENKNIKATNKSSKYIGVIWAKSLSTWKALLVYNKAQLHLGLFCNEIEAAKVYNQQALFLNNEKKCSYKLNDIPNFITNPKNIYNEKHKNKLINI